MKDSIVIFKFYGPLGIEVLSGKYDSLFVVKNYYADSLKINLVEKLYGKTGVMIKRKMLEHMLLFDYSSLFQEIRNSVNDDIEVTMQKRTVVKSFITVKDTIGNSVCMLSFIKKEKFPLQILIDYKNLTDYFKITLDIYNLHN